MKQLSVYDYLENNLKVLELFGGIGACSTALKRLNIPYEIVDYVEIDKYAVKSFNAIHNTNFEPQDISSWNKNVKVDLIMHGSPCQDFSLAGKQAGGDKDSGTRSSLMYETLRIVEKLRPRYVVWENVKNILSKKHKHNFDAYLEKLKELGYSNYYQVLNSNDYGIPQNRERVFTISVLGNHKFEFPQKQELKLRLKDLLEDSVDKKYYLNNETIDNIILNNQDTIENIIKNNNKRAKHQQELLQSKEICRCIPAGTHGSTPHLLKTVVSENPLKIRKLTAKECWRLMGFNDEEFEKAEKVNSNTQLYKQAGNSIVVNVLTTIFKELLKEDL